MSKYNLTLKELQELQFYLTDDEFKQIEKLQDEKRVEKIATILNNRHALPKKFAYLVDDYKGFEGIELINTIIV